MKMLNEIELEIVAGGHISIVSPGEVQPLKTRKLNRAIAAAVRPAAGEKKKCDNKYKNESISLQAKMDSFFQYSLIFPSDSTSIMSFAFSLNAQK